MAAAVVLRYLLEDTAPNGASSARQERHRHARAGNRRITARQHIIAVV